MASVLRQALAAIKTAIEGIDGSGDYNNSFANAEIMYGWQLTSPGHSEIGVCIDCDGVASTTGPNLCQWTRASDVAIGVWQPTARQEALLNAADLMDDIMMAIESDRTLGLYSVGARDVSVEGEAFRGDDVGFKGHAYALIRVRFTYAVSTGG